MIVDRQEQHRPPSPEPTRAVKARKTRTATVQVEPLEERTMLSRLLPKGIDLAPQFQEVRAGTGTAYQLKVSGPGSVRAKMVGRGRVAITLSGTTEISQVTLNQGRTHARFGGNPLEITRIDVRSGELGSFQAYDSADLNGPVTPLKGPVDSLKFDAIGPMGRIEVQGNLAELDVKRNVSIGPDGRIEIQGGLTKGGQIGGSLTVLGTGVTIAGPSAPISIGGDMILGLGGLWQGTGPLSVGGGLGLDSSRLDTGPLTVGVGILATGSQINAASILVGGRLAIIASQVNTAGPVWLGGDLTAQGGALNLSGLAPLTVGGGVTLSPGGQIQTNGDLHADVTIGGPFLIDGGAFLVGRDLVGTVRVGGKFSVLQGGRFDVGRDFSTFRDRQFDPQSMIPPGGLEVGGDLVLASAGSLTVGRNLDVLNVIGDLDTSGGGSIRVGGNLDLVSVTGTFQGQGRSARDLVVGLNLGNLRVLGARPGRGSVDHADIDVGKNILGVDLVHGLFDSILSAGILIDGSKPTTVPGCNIGPDGPVAVYNSEIRAGVQIRNLTICGDVVSDRPTNPLGMPARIVAGLDRQDVLNLGSSISGLVITGTLTDAVVAAGVKPYGGDGTVSMSCTNVPGDGGFNTYDKPAGRDFTAPPYDAANDPTIDDCVVPGSINAIVLRGVISSNHGDEADYAGFFAADTQGVTVRQ
ncbi:MAG: hypothetical protein ABI353_03500 [Isosphaeraceae bacterium]